MYSLMKRKCLFSRSSTARQDATTKVGLATVKAASNLPPSASTKQHPTTPSTRCKPSRPVPPPPLSQQQPSHPIFSRSTPPPPPPCCLLPQHHQHLSSSTETSPKAPMSACLVSGKASTVSTCCITTPTCVATSSAAGSPLCPGAFGQVDCDFARGT